VWWQPGAMCRNLVVVATKGTLLGLGCHYHDLEKTQGKKHFISKICFTECYEYVSYHISRAVTSTSILRESGVAVWADRTSAGVGRSRTLSTILVAALRTCALYLLPLKALPSSGFVRWSARISSLVWGQSWSSPSLQGCRR
jgi:hypothetical protein